MQPTATRTPKQADTFYLALVEALDDTPVVQWDERLTTLEAQRSLSQAGLKAKEHRDHVDSAAAVIIQPLCPGPGTPGSAFVPSALLM